MTLFAVNAAAVAIGLVFLAAIVAVVAGYLVHMRMLRRQIARALRERASRLAASCQASTQAPSEPVAEPGLPVLDVVTVQSLRRAQAPTYGTSAAVQPRPAVVASHSR